MINWEQNRKYWHIIWDALFLEKQGNFCQARYMYEKAYNFAVANNDSDADYALACINRCREKHQSFSKKGD